MAQTSDESEVLKKAIVGHLFDNDEAFREAVKQYVVENFSNDQTLRAIFKDKAAATINKLFGFRKPPTKNENPKAKTQPKKRTQAKPRRIADNNKLAHEDAILKVLKPAGKAFSKEDIFASLKKMNHRMHEDNLPGFLSKLKRDGLIVSIKHTSTGPNDRTLLDWAKKKE